MMIVTVAMDLLAAATSEAVNNGTTIGTIIGGAILVLLGGGAGGGAVVLKKRRSSGDSNRGDRFNRDECDRRHQAWEKLSDERKATTDNEIAEVKDDVKEMRKENREGFQQLFNKIDELRKG